MKSRSEIIKIIFYTILFFPVIIFTLEITSFFLNKSNNKFVSGTIYDSLTGWRKNCDDNYINSENLDYLICDKNGFIKTPHTTKDKTKNTYGILLLGNSVAMGEGLYGFNNEKTFASQLETTLREKDTSIDVVNAAYSGFNTWQEHVEAVRYQNSEPFHDDLPHANLIVSFGGIQDFWNFIRLLSTSDNRDEKKYSFANSMMIDKNNIEYINFLSSSSLGNIKSGFFAFLNSIKSRSYFFSYLDHLKSTNDIKAGFYERKQLTINTKSYKENKNLKEILNLRFNLNFEEYEKIKSYSISSVVRNINSNNKLDLESNYLYVYAPNYFSTLTKDQIKSDDFKYLIGIKHLIGNPIFPLKILEREMHIIEKDYRETLFKELKKRKTITFFDYSLKAEDTSWFLDYSHLTEFGANQISSILSRQILSVIKKSLPIER